MNADPSGPPARVAHGQRRTGMQAVRFAITGVLATATHTLVLFLLVDHAGMSPVPANGLAFLLAVMVTWTGQSMWVFAGALPDPNRLPRFLVTVTSGFAANLLIMWLAVDIAGASHWVGLALVLLLVPPTTFLVAKRWVFGRGADR